MQPVADRLVEHVVDQRGLPRARHAGHAAEHPERELHVDALEVVLGRLLHRQVALGAAPALGHLDPARAGQELAGERVGDLLDLLRRALGDHAAAVLARARAEVEQVVGGPHRALVVLDHDHRVAEVAQPLQGRDQARVVALVEADRGLVEDVEHPDQGRADLGRQPDPLRLAARQRAPRPGPSTGSPRRRRRGSAAAPRSRAGSGGRSAARCR